MNALTIGSVIGSGHLLEEAQASLHDLPVRVVFEQREIGDWAGFLQRLEKSQPDVVLLALDQLADSLDDAVRQIKAASSSPQVIIMHTSADPQSLLRSIRASADEYLYPPLQADLRKALERMAAERARHRAGAMRRGKVFGFLSAKGGCGATTLACHLAVELNRQTGLEVLLADFDLGAGLVGFLMKSHCRYTLLDAVANIQRLDLSFWKALVSNGRGGVEVIMAPSHSFLQLDHNWEDFRSVLPFVRSNYDWTVVDLGRSLTPLAMTVLDEIDEVFLVTTPEVPALHQAKQVVQALASSGYSRQRLRLILNRMPKRADLSPEELERMLGLPVYTTLPNEYPGLYEAYAEGTLVPPSSRLGKHFSRVAAKMAGLQPNGKRRFHLF